MNHPIEIVGRIDVVAEVWKLELVQDEIERRGMGSKLAGTVRAIKGLEDLGKRETQGIRRSVGGGDDRYGAGTRWDRERGEVGRSDPGDVGVDDKAHAVEAGERRLHRSGLATAGIGDDLDLELTCHTRRRRVIGDEAHIRREGGRGLEHVTEHRERHFNAEIYRQTSFPAGAKRDDNSDHRVRVDTDVSHIRHVM